MVPIKLSEGKLKTETQRDGEEGGEWASSVRASEIHLKIGGEMKEVCSLCESKVAEKGRPALPSGIVCHCSA